MLKINILKKASFVIFFVLMSLLSNLSYCTSNIVELNTIPKVDSTSVNIYAADINIGYIGYSEYENIDFPKDNIFKFNIDKDIDLQDRVLLKFELNGVSDLGSVAIIVNDNAAVGGYVISENKKWKKKSFPLYAKWLRKGVNRIQFTKLPNVQKGYSIKNVKIVVKSDMKTNDRIVFYDDIKNYPCYNGKAYIRGYINYPSDKIVSLYIDSKPVSVHDNVFETIYARKDNSNSNKVILTIKLKDGSIHKKEIILKEKNIDDIKILDKIKEVKTNYYTIDSKLKYEINEKDFSFVVFENTLKNDLNVSVTKLRTVDLPPMNLDLTNVTAANAGYRLLPHGNHFSGEGAILKLPYDKNSIPKGYTEEDIQTFYFDIKQSQWISLKRDSIDTKNGFIYSRVQHFTDYINGVIATPESTESTNFTSTYFNDLLKANPVSAVTLINPPTASPTGEAGISYPIEVPPGRNGLQPNLAVTYSSDAGSSWIGYGWNINIPSIDVETQWGVPRYLSDKESEAYRIAGSQLVTMDADNNPYLPQRTDPANWISRTENREFYNRIESPSGFTEYIRKGDNPDNYWWKVTDRHGTKYYYGGDTQLDNNYVIKTSDGNIVKWLLKKIEDTYGNTIDYEYDGIYVKNISYAHHIVNNNNGNSTTNEYNIEFILNTNNRLDPRSTARTGVMIVDDKRLNSIVVTGPTGKIRSYEFEVIEGKFKKSLLSKLICKDASSNEIYNHTFEYYDELSNKSFMDEEDWETTDDVENAGSYFFKGDRQYSSLGGNHSHAEGASIYVGVGVPDPSSPGTISGTVGASFSFTNPNSKAKVRFMDINGDGLPDKIYRNTSGNTVYDKNTSRIGGAAFSSYIGGNLNSTLFENSSHNLTANGSSTFEFGHSNDKTYSFGVRGYFSGISIGTNTQKTNSSSSTYLQDINGDGFVDLVDQGIVFFNTTSPLNYNDNIALSSALNSVCNIKEPDMNNINSIFTISEEEIISFRDEHPRLDVVKKWVAPRDGDITIPTSTVTKTSSGGDGVIVFIQHNSSLVYDGINNPVVMGSPLTINEMNFHVSKGDVIYFRASSGKEIDANGENDEIEWDVEVQYQNQLNTPDVYGKNPDVYKYSDDAIPTQFGEIIMADKGGVDINIIVHINGNPSDQIYLEIFKNNTLFDRQHCPTTVNITQIPVDKMDKFTFRLVSNSNVDWNMVEIYNTSSFVADYDTQPDTTYTGSKIPIEYHFHKAIEDGTIPEFHATKMPVSNDIVNMSPYMIELQHSGNIANMDNTDKYFYVSIKDDTKTYFQQKWKVSGTDNSIPTLTSVDNPIINMDIPNNAIIFSTINFEDKELFDKGWKITNVKLELVSDNTKYQDLTPTLYVYNVDQSILFNSLFRNWGVFVYNPDGKDHASHDITPYKLINENVLDFGNYQQTNNTVSGPAFYDKAHFPLSYYDDKGTARWRMFDGENTNISLTGFTPSRLIEDNVDISSPFGGYTSGTYPGLETKTKSLNSAVNGSGAGVSVTLSSTGKSETTIEYLDLNGDRIPDVVGNDGDVAYTTHNGDFFYEQSDPGTSFSVNENIGYGVSAGSHFAFSFSSRSARQEDKISLSASLSGNYSKSKSTSSSFFADINGDGLPDRVFVQKDNNKDYYYVKYNLGYSFSNPVQLFEPVENTESKSFGLGAGFSFFDGSFSGGVGYNNTQAKGKSQFVDVNGDGLVDFIYINSSGSINIKLNTGNGFVNYNGYNITPLNDIVNRTQMIGNSLNAAFTISLNIFGINFAINPGINIVNSMNRTEVALMDIDGDGYMDVLTSTPETAFSLLDNPNPDFDNYNIIKAHRSKIGKTNKLKKVINSIGGNFQLDYALTPATIKHPNGKYVLNSLIVDDGILDDGPISKMAYKYDNGYYDRCERAFLGFEKVNTLQLDNTGNVYRTIANTYINSNIYQKGLLLESKVYDNSNALAKTTTNTYTARKIIPAVNNNHTTTDPPNDLAVERQSIINTMLESTETKLNMNGDIGETASMQYDNVGNITSYTYSNGSGGYTTNIGYFKRLQDNIQGIAETMEIPGLRGKSAVINDKGKITKLTVDNTPSPESITEFEYYDNGNLKKITLPNSGGNKEYTFTYENTMDLYVAKIKDHLNFESYNNNYNYKFGVPSEVVDINGNSTSFTYDDAGRLTSFKAPSCFGGSYGASFSYDLSSVPISATTQRDDPEYTNGKIKSVIFADGFGKTLETIAQASVNGANKTVVNGFSIKDEFGRVTKSFYPIASDNYTFTAVSGKNTLYEYDILDRKTKKIMPGDRTFKYNYSHDGYNLKTVLTDANNNTSSSISEYNGPVVSQSSNIGFTTTFEYDDINQLTKSKQPLGNETTYTYDKGGRILSRTSPDAGTINYTYDALGNITQKQDRWTVNYTYEYGRMKNVEYADHPQLNVEYTYDDPNSNGKGRLSMIKDGTGSQKFYYGNIGEITKIERSIAIPYKTEAAEFVTQWKYDLWNRVQEMIYPDGEEVDFAYDHGGNLNGMSGTKNGNSYTYISSILYDEFGAKTKMSYGNGVVTNYTYKPDERWLNTLNSTFGNGTAFNINYSYDKMGNVSSLSKSTGNQSFTYDKDYRLLTSSGDWTGTVLFPNQNCLTNGINADYSSKYSYDKNGNILTKWNNINRNDPVYSTMSKDITLNYTYSGNKISSIDETYISDIVLNDMNRKSNHTYNYDANGNITQIEQEMKDTNNGGNTKEVQTKRGIVWQEGNMMRALSDDNVVTHFVYDANGERVLKLSESYHRIYVNSELSADPVGEIGFTMYVNPYMTVRHDGQYTKHYFAGSQRILSKIGNPDGYGTDPTLLGLGLPNGKKSTLQSLLQKNYTDLGIDLNFVSSGTSDLGLSAGNNDVETHRYYFTSDHIGSSNVITDASGTPVQQIEYMPFGESYVDWRELSWNTPYRFTGKEQDPETGLYYYGARYYDAKIGRFMSVDPLAEKYPGWSPYTYTLDNPVRLVDPTGREPEWHEDGDGKWVADSGDGAETLVQDARITRQEAYNIMEEQGHGTYVDKNDGITKSKINPGGKVDISSAACAKNDKEANEIIVIRNINQLKKNNTKINKIDNSLDSIKKLYKNSNDAIQGKHDGLGERNAGNMIYHLMANYKRNREISKFEHIKDSVINVNKN